MGFERDEKEIVRVTSPQELLEKLEKDDTVVVFSAAGNQTMVYFGKGFSEGSAEEAMIKAFGNGNFEKDVRNSTTKLFCYEVDKSHIAVIHTLKQVLNH